MSFDIPNWSLPQYYELLWGGKNGNAKKHTEGHKIQTALETCVGGIVKVINSLTALLKYENFLQKKNNNLLTFFFFFFSFAYNLTSVSSEKENSTWFKMTW